MILQENQNILRDAAHLQTQLRHFDSLVESRYILLRIRPNARSNWIALSVAYYLAENPKEALKVLEHYESILKVSLPCQTCFELRVDLRFW